MKKLFKIISISILILFLSLFFSRYTTFYENKSILTEKAIAQFEKDLKSGKKINPQDYIEKEKNYNNKISSLGLKASSLIEATFSKALKILIRALGD